MDEILQKISNIRDCGNYDDRIVYAGFCRKSFGLYIFCL